MLFAHVCPIEDCFGETTVAPVVMIVMQDQREME